MTLSDEVLLYARSSIQARTRGAGKEIHSRASERRFLIASAGMDKRMKRGDLQKNSPTSWLISQLSLAARLKERCSAVVDLLRRAFASNFKTLAGAAGVSAAFQGAAVHSRPPNTRPHTCEYVPYRRREHLPEQGAGQPSSHRELLNIGVSTPARRHTSTIALIGGSGSFAQFAGRPPERCAPLWPSAASVLQWHCRRRRRRGA